MADIDDEDVEEEEQQVTLGVSAHQLYYDFMANLRMVWFHLIQLFHVTNMQLFN
jgi:hypothetical protein